MRTDHPPLLPIFRSRIQGEVLSSLLLDEDAEHSLTDLARRHGSSLAAVHREVDRLEQAEILESRRVGNTRLVRANGSSPLYESLRQLVLLTFGPAVVIGAAVGPIAGVEEVFLHGEWAARILGEDGPPPAEIGAVVVGDPDPQEVSSRIADAEQRLQRAVYVTLRTREKWESEDDLFSARVRSGPLVPAPTP